MSEDISGAAGPSGGQLDARARRALLVSFLAAVMGVVLGATAALAAAILGASTLLGLLLMSAFAASGVAVAVTVVRRADRPHDGEARDPDGAGSENDETRLEQQLSARYGVRIERVAPHVWRIRGELIEAVWDPWTGRLVAGGKELRL